MITENSEMVKIDEDLYSRQLYVLGKDAMARMASSSILICGLGGLGVEIAKNVILGGVRFVTLQDTQCATWTDLSSQFYLSKASLGKNRAGESLQKLSELNPYVTVDLSEEPLTKEYLSRNQFTVVVLTEGAQSAAAMEEILDYCHNHGIFVIVSETRGIFARVFCDFGPGFVVVDPTGESIKTALIGDVTREEIARIDCLSGQRHQLHEGDYIRFEEVLGMTELNFLKDPVKIVEITGPSSFKIQLDTRKYEEYLRGGSFVQLKMPKKLDFKSWREAANSSPPGILETDFAKIETNEAIHLAFQSLDDFVSSGGGNTPKLWDDKDAEKLVEIYLSKRGTSGENDEISDDDLRIVRLLSYLSTAQVCPMNGYIGGIVAQEVMKACSGKFHPIHQWLYFDSLESLSNELLQNLDDTGKFLDRSFINNYSSSGTRYDGQIPLFGKVFQETLGNLKYFVVGAGAIGCELLKNFAMLGVAAGDKGKIFVTDMDHIERSNLNRQFLFRNEDVGRPKSKVAAEAVQKMNGNVKIESFETRVGPETENLFSDAFFNNLDGVANALDNVEARRYVDQRCIQARKSLLESGTMGTRGNTQVVLPSVTESYSSTKDAPQKHIPICTLKHFPNSIEHTIQWARDMFEGIFKQQADMVKMYLSDPVSFLGNKLNQTVDKLETLRKALDTERPKNFRDCVKWARLLWEEHFNNEIQQLLFNFPKDKILEPLGEPFWSGMRRCPDPLMWGGTTGGELGRGFVFCAANLRAEMYGIEQNRDQAQVEQMANEVQVTKFVPVSGVKIPTSEEEAEEQQQVQGRVDKGKVEQLRKSIPSVEELKTLGFTGVIPLEFEKDDDTNLHIDFVFSASNSRAQNYSITLADRLETKGIAGKIIPAIATTTSVVSSLVSLELIKLFQHQPITEEKLEYFKDVYINLALPMFAFNEPTPVSKKKYNDTEWTVWDRFEVNGDLAPGKEMTLAEFLQYFDKEHGLQIVLICFESLFVYSSSIGKEKREERLRWPMSQLFETVTKRKIGANMTSIKFLLGCYDLSGNDVDVPYVSYILPK